MSPTANLPSCLQDSHWLPASRAVAVFLAHAVLQRDDGIFFHPFAVTFHQTAETLANFNGSIADGTWTLFFGDEVAGGGQATLNGWSLDITAVPEPMNVAMAIFGVGFIGVGAVRVYRNLRNAKFLSSPQGALILRDGFGFPSARPDHGFRFGEGWRR